MCIVSNTAPSGSPREELYTCTLQFKSLKEVSSHCVRILSSKYITLIANILYALPPPRTCALSNMQPFYPSSSTPHLLYAHSVGSCRTLTLCFKRIGASSIGVRVMKPQVNINMFYQPFLQPSKHETTKLCVHLCRQ